MKINLKKGDILTYRYGEVHLVNHPTHYRNFYNYELEHKKDPALDIIKIQRYIKFLWFYRLKTIYKKNYGKF